MSNTMEFYSVWIGISLKRQLWIGALGDQLSMCLNLELFFFRVSSLAYPNLLGKKGYVVVDLTFISALGLQSSIERLKVSRHLAEEAMNYFEECVSISTMDSTDFSSPEDPQPNSILNVQPKSNSRFSTKGDQAFKSPALWLINMAIMRLVN